MFTGDLTLQLNTFVALFLIVLLLEMFLFYKLTTVY